MSFKEGDGMNIEVIAVGDEVVKGYTLNTNATYIAKRMQEIGVNTVYHTAVCDCKEDIKWAINTAIQRSEGIFIIGGLGPTEDDLTKEAVCECLGQSLVFYPHIFESIKRYFTKTGRTTPENNKKQAYFPEQCVILDNDYGTAPGCILEADGKKLILLPGPPRELIPMLEDKVIPYFEKNLEDAIATVDIKIFGLGESHLAEKLGEKLGVFEDHVVATYVSNNEIIVRIRTYGKTQEETVARCEKIKNDITQCLEEYIIGYNNSKLEENVVELLKLYDYTIATAESCTGGLLAGTLINCSGISALLGESIVTYSNEAKMKYLHVKEETLKSYGAVSAETAREMAIGIKTQARTSIGVSTTGIAGPEGGTVAKPVGTVFIGIAIEDMCYTYKLHLDGTRQEIRQKAVKNALYQLYKELKKR